MVGGDGLEEATTERVESSTPRRPGRSATTFDVVNFSRSSATTIAWSGVAIVYSCAFAGVPMWYVVEEDDEAVLDGGPVASSFGGARKYLMGAVILVFCWW